MNKFFLFALECLLVVYGQQEQSELCVKIAAVRQSKSKDLETTIGDLCNCEKLKDQQGNL